MLNSLRRFAVPFVALLVLLALAAVPANGSNGALPPIPPSRPPVRPAPTTPSTPSSPGNGPVLDVGGNNGINTTTGTFGNNNTNNNMSRSDQDGTSPPPPPAESLAVQQARAALAAAHDGVDKAQEAFDAIIVQLKKDFETSGDFVLATADAKTAQGKYDAAAAVVRASLANNADYQAALQNKQDKAQALSKVRDGGGTQDQLSAAAATALEAAGKVTKLETQALSADPATAAAKAELNSAGTKLQQLKNGFSTGMKDKNAWMDARKALDDAKNAVPAAEARLADALKSSRPGT